MSYKKQNFVDGQTLTANHLCNIENGIITIIEGDNTPVQLFDSTKTTANTYLNSEGVEVSVSPNNQGLAWHITDYIPVNNIDLYYYTILEAEGTAPHSAFYDENKKLLSIFKQIQGEKILLSIPVGAKFVRLSIAVMSGVFSFELCKENLSLKALNDKINNTSDFNTDDFLNYEICINGDSIETESAGRWPVLLKQAVNFKSYKNIAIGGTRIKGQINSDERIAQIPETTNILITAGGTNDWAQNIALGSLETLEDPETFYGAVDLYIKKVLERCPNIIVIMASNPYGCCPGRFTASKDVDSGTYNDINAPVHRYAQAIREVAEYNSVYYVPLYEECGINKHNYESYILSEYNNYGHHVYLHPSDAGAAKMMQVYLRHLQIVIQRAQQQNKL